MNYVLLFPGQGSQSVGMLTGLAAEFPQIGETFSEASDAVGWDIGKLIAEGPAKALQQADKVQPAIVAADIAIARVWSSLVSKTPTALAGHSLGEYAALVSAGVLDFADALKLVGKRGRFMAEAAGEKGGRMAAVLGLSDEALEKLCAAAPEGEMVEPANLNAPGQVVIALSTPALAWLKENGKAFGARKVVELAMSVPSHCSVMKPAAAKLAKEMSALSFNLPKVPVHHNVDTRPRDTPEAIRKALAEQLCNPVRWSQTVAGLVENGVGLLVECGPGKVLGGLNRRIARDVASFSIESPEQLHAAAAAANGDD